VNVLSVLPRNRVRNADEVYPHLNRLVDGHPKRDMQAVWRAVATDVGDDKMPNQFGMKTLMAASLWIAGLMLHAHAAPITYNVNIGSSPDTVTGTITTDGNMGNLSRRTS
jgi:hypothetical protein